MKSRELILSDFAIERRQSSKVVSVEVHDDGPMLRT